MVSHKTTGSSRAMYHIWLWLEDSILTRDVHIAHCDRRLACVVVIWWVVSAILECICIGKTATRNYLGTITINDNPTSPTAIADSNHSKSIWYITPIIITESNRFHTTDMLWEKFQWILPLYMKPISFLHSKASDVCSVTTAVFIDFWLNKRNVFSQHIGKKRMNIWIPQNKLQGIEMSI